MVPHLAAAHNDMQVVVPGRLYRLDTEYRAERKSLELGITIKQGKTKNGNSVSSPAENNSMSMSFGKKLITL